MPRYRLSIDIPRWLDKLIVWPVLVWRWFWYDHTYRRVRLLPDKYAEVDAKDFHEISKYTWWACRTSRSCAAARFIQKGNAISLVYMHRQIMQSELDSKLTNPKSKLIVDHKNRDATDNRRANLRLATQRQNSRNCRGHKGKTSKYKGVSRYRGSNRWRVMIHVDKKGISLGYFESEIEAAKAYDKAARKYHGEFAYQNFGDDTKPLTRWARIRNIIRKIIHELTRIYTNIFRR